LQACPATNFWDAPAPKICSLMPRRPTFSKEPTMAIEVTTLGAPLHAIRCESQIQPIN
jgi:hypothetical protein